MGEKSPLIRSPSIDQAVARLHNTLNAGEIESAIGIVLLHTPDSGYFADAVQEGVQRLGMPVKRLNIKRSMFPDGEKYYRIDLQGTFELLGKTAIYVCPLLSDSDILEVVRVGAALATYGVRRRIFIIPFLAYSTMERVVLPGEVVTAKITCQMISDIGQQGNGNVFILLDLHTSGLCHYFEGSCTRVEIYAHEVLESALPALGFDPETFMFASGDLGRSQWVHDFAKRNGTAVAFIRKSRQFKDGQTETTPCEVIGSVQNKHVIIYDDMTRTGGTVIHAADEYLKAGALSVDAMITHLRITEERIVAQLSASAVRKFVISNSCPISMSECVRNNPKFIVMDAAPQFVERLAELIPRSARTLALAGLTQLSGAQTPE